jgi:hypothetical protein
LQQLQALRDKLRGVKVHTGSVSTRPIEARDKSFVYGIAPTDEENRNRLGRVLRCSRNYKTAACNDQRNVATDELVGLFTQQIEIAVGPSVFNRDVLPFNVSR